MGRRAVALTPAQMDAKLDEHFRFEAADDVEGVLATLTGEHPLDVAYSLATSRAAMEHRAVLTAGDHDTLVSALQAVADGSTTAHAVRGQARAAGKTAFLFTGQGSQRLGMGRALYATYPAFAAALDAMSLYAWRLPLGTGSTNPSI